MSYKEGNPYAPLKYAEGSAMARTACPRWRVVSIVLGAMLPGRAWPKSAFQIGWEPPPPDIAGDGPPAWSESNHTGASVWHDGAPPAPPGVVCDENWQPVQIVTRSGRRLPAVVGS